MATTRLQTKAGPGDQHGPGDRDLPILPFRFGIYNIAPSGQSDRPGGNEPRSGDPSSGAISRGACVTQLGDRDDFGFLAAGFSPNIGRAT
jgi:hypothetical protein